MTALTKDIALPSREAAAFSDPVAADAVIFRGALVALDASGNAIPGNTIANGAAVVRGVALEAADNAGGAAGAIRVQTVRGCFPFRNSASGDLIARTEIGKTVYLVDDQTVAKTSATNGRIAAGICRDIDARGVWVEI